MRGPEVLAAVRASGGDMAAVAEKEIGPAFRWLAARGLYAEPTSAIVVPAIRTFLGRGTVRPGEKVVAVLTGTALKAADAVSGLLG